MVKIVMTPKPLKKILVANRGEIALRIIRAARELGIATVAVYSDTDAGSLWTEQATEAYSLGDGPVADTYLNITAIITLAKRCGADAIHPGYGFLSENYLFARACEEQNICFIGPSPEVLKLMGDKIAANDLVKELGIAVPDKIVCSPEEMIAMEDTIDYPVLVKAAGGGGGKGMRLVRQPNELMSVIASASNEAVNYFADDRIYLEKYLQAPRHIEVQLLGDMHGNIVHLFERECSIQRRHQKIIEEAPAAVLTSQTREAIIQTALKIGRSMNFYSAGTIEFLLDEKDEFYFLEMNPRIQVEHGITEMITGVDIVKEQITIAGGSPLSFEAKYIRPGGHAIEARIFAEDPENNLLPSPGQIYYYRQPHISGVRIESAIAVNCMISPDYDPLIAKVLVHAPSREQAIKKLSIALDEFIIAGVPHNIPLLKMLIRNKEYNNNAVSTTFLDERMPEFTLELSMLRKSTDPVQLAIAAAIRILSEKVKNTSPSPWQSGYWRNVKQIRFRIDTEIVELDYDVTAANAYDFYRNKLKYTVSHIKTDGNQIRFTINGKACQYYISSEQDGLLEVSDGNLGFTVGRFKLPDHAGFVTDQEPADTGDGIVMAPLPGRIMKIMVVAGDQVERGDNLLIIESMKLENSVLAMQPGLIQEISISEGDYVKKNDPLIHIRQVIQN